MPHTAGVADLVCRGLTATPGVVSVAICVNGTLLDRSEEFPSRNGPEVAPCEGCPSLSGDGNRWLERGPSACLPIQTVNRFYGGLVFFLRERDSFAIYLPFLANTTNILATVIENREQERLLRALNDDLIRQIARAQEAEASLKEAHLSLEQRVKERTRELKRLTETLIEEIRERKLAQEALSREAAFNAAAADLARALISTSSLDEVSSVVLEHARRLTGSELAFVGSVDPQIGQLIYPASSEVDRQTPAAAWRTHIFERLKGQRLLSNTPMRYTDPGDAPEVYPPIHRFLSVPILTDGEPIGQVVLANAERNYAARDLDLVERLASLYVLAVQRKRQAEERRNLADQVQRSQKLEAVGVLAGGIAHDFRNLLQVIMGWVELLLSRGEQEPGYRELLEVRRAAARGAELTQQLLAFSRKTEILSRPLDLNEVARSVANMLERTLPKMIRIELRLAEDLEPVNGDPGQLEQVLLNLAVNARDAMPEGGTIVIATEEASIETFAPAVLSELGPGRYARLSVTDTGYGMDGDTVKRIFEPFFTTKGVGMGTGLGLSVAYGIAKGHGGHLSCTSTPRQGTTFTVLLPLCGVAVLSDSNEAEPTVKTQEGRGETVLIVDDEPAIRSLAETVLTAKGYHTRTAASGEDALSIYRHEASRIDLVILDLSMPGMGGQACLREILRFNPAAKVIVATGYSTVDQLAGRPEGTSGFLAKPYPLAALLEIVRNTLDA